VIIDRQFLNIIICDPVQLLNAAFTIFGKRMKIIFNGFAEELEGGGLTIGDLLDRTQEDDPAVIVEVNGRYVHRKDFNSVKIIEGDRVEFIHPSFGG